MNNSKEDDNKIFTDCSNNIFLSKENINSIIEKDSLGKRIKNFLLDKRILYTMSVLIFICVCIVVIKAFYYKSKFVVINYREDEETKVYAGNDIDSNMIKGSAASNLINCLNTKANINNLPSNVKNVIDKINKYYSQSKNYFAFKYVDIYTGFSVSYNENQKIFAASSIKAATDIYVWKMASLGEINLDDKVKYTSKYYNNGSGLLKNRKFNVNYTIRDLLKLSTVDSDNAAHNMLMDKYGRKKMLEFWKEKGTKAIFTQNNNWGPTSAHDAAIYMNELYKLYVDNDEFGGAAMTNFLNSYPKFIKNSGGYKIASKSGWAGSSLHDVAIVFADNPYIVVALSNLGNMGYADYFKTASSLAEELHTEYWKYKMMECNDIKQY